MAAAAGVFSQISGAPARTGKAAPMASTSSGTNGTASSSAGSATISANDFLTLLVTEMQNQDPTAATDPNEYINQLVNVNSLEQLISINQNLQTALGQTTSPTTTASASATGQSGQSTSPQVTATAQAASSSGADRPAPGVAGAAAHGARIVLGNLNVPESSAAANHVASALNGRP